MVRSRIVFDWPRPVKWPWLSMSPGDGQGAAEVDDLGAVADVAVEALGARAEGGDAVAAEGDPGGRREPVVDGHDLAVDEDEVGRLGGLLLAAVDEEADGEDGDEDDDQSQAAVSFGHGVFPSRPGSPGAAQKIYRSCRPVNRGVERGALPA